MKLDNLWIREVQGWDTNDSQWKNFSARRLIKTNSGDKERKCLVAFLLGEHKDAIVLRWPVTLFQVVNTDQHIVIHRKENGEQVIKLYPDLDTAMVAAELNWDKGD